MKRFGHRVLEDSTATGSTSPPEAKPTGQLPIYVELDTADVRLHVVIANRVLVENERVQFRARGTVGAEIRIHDPILQTHITNLSQMFAHYYFAGVYRLICLRHIPRT